MLADLKPQPADKILALMQAFRDDPREVKIDLGVGVYRDAEGRTPVMRAVKAAERRLVEAQTTKAYTGLAGDPAFGVALARLVLGDGFDADRLAMVAAPGGTGAIHQGLQVLRMAAPGATVHLPAPTWPNHPALLRHVGLRQAEYRYFDEGTRSVDFAGMVTDLEQAAPGDVVLVHGCCHNPTGADLTLGQWGQLVEVLRRRDLTPFVDLAYLGFGDGLEADAAGVRRLLGGVPEALVAVSCSKNFGIYRERAGLLMAWGRPEARDLAQGAMAAINRMTYSFPPDHGARIVSTILEDDALRADWQAELDEVREGMLKLRRQLADELRRRANSDRFDFIADHRGMFSRLGATPAQVEALRRDHGIYMVGDSRFNVAGLNARTVPVLAEAIVAVGV